MPFPLIPAALGVCFLLVWAFIGGMLFRDTQLATRCDSDVEVPILPLVVPRPHWPRRTKSLRSRSVSRPHTRAAS